MAGSAVEKGLVRSMAMDDATWARHASPWSVWTRIATLPLLLVTLWSHAWIGWGGMALALGAVIAWTWANPRLFPPPASTDNWASKATFGERVWLNRKAVPIPAHHARAAMVLGASSGAGFVVAASAALLNDLTWTLTGGITCWFAKMWFADRMVWLYEDMKDADPRYHGWLRG
jgi:hypothetical protein